MTSKHPITAPIELVQQWASDKDYDERDWLYELHIAIQAAQWGADQELEACCALMDDWGLDEADLCAARRPQASPSLKEQALKAVQRFYANGHEDCTDEEMKDDFDTIRRALEALDD